MSTVIIAAGGTGGHIFPALAMAEAIRKSHPDWSIHFVGARDGMEEKIIPQNGYPLFLLSIGRLNRNVGTGERLLTLVRLPLAIVRSVLFLIKTRPRFVLGVGGHASAPILLAAALLRFKTFIWEPNAYPGMANRWLSRFVDESLVVFSHANKHLRTKRSKTVGMPVRESIAKTPSLTTRDSRFHVLIFGGSQGARGINKVVSEMIVTFERDMAEVSFVHQTGPLDYQRLLEFYGGRRDNLEVHEFLNDMDQRYAWADLVICRSGTGTLSEIAACGKPAILIPLPTAADDHQQKNAESLLESGAVEMILQNDLTPALLKDLILNLKSDEKKRAMMAQKIKTFFQPQAAERIVEYLIEESK